MIIRRALPADIGQIAEIHVRASREAYGDIYPAQHFQSFTVAARVKAFSGLLDEARTEIVVAETTEIEGFTVHAPTRDADTDPFEVYEIQSIYVNPLNWSQGVGTSLMMAAEEFAEREGFKRVTLWVLEGNRRAMRFYHRLDYQPDGLTKKTTLGEKELRERRLVKSLRA